MWCPKCDMEYIEGVTVCTDCGGELVDKEAWLAEQAEKASEQNAAAEKKIEELHETIENLTDEDIEVLEERRQTMREMAREPSVYETSKAKYEDNKSSASAFLIVGIILTAGAVALWLGLFNLGTVGKIAITVFAVFCLATAVISNKNAEKIKCSIKDEEEAYKKILTDFVEKHTAEELDSMVTDKDQGPEELALSRLDIIQDILTTENIIEDKTMAAAIAEDAYAKIYE